MGASYELEDDIYYYITITDVKPTTSAEEKYKTDKAYTDTGDSNTDASADGNYGTMGNANDSSSEKKGFPSNDNQTVKIIATDEKEADKAGAAVEVSFTNEHNGRTNGGYGVRNNFKLDKNNQYQYTQPAAKN